MTGLLHAASYLLYLCFVFFFFQAEDGIRDLVRSRGLGDVYKRQGWLAARITEQRALAKPELGRLAKAGLPAASRVKLSLIHI